MFASSLAYRLTPIAVRDLVGGTAGTGVWIAAIIGGCALTSPALSAWFAFWGVTGVLSLLSVAPQIGDAIRAKADRLADEPEELRRAA